MSEFSRLLPSARGFSLTSLLALAIALSICAAASASAQYTLTTLANFHNSNGRWPEGDLLADASGNLYGTTRLGGANGLGTVFEVAAGTHALTTLVTFNGANGDGPTAGLIADASGNLYGTTIVGGLGVGTVFGLANDVNHTLTTLVTFNDTNGDEPDAALIADASGNLYGTTGGNEPSPFGDAGTVFKLAAGTHAFSTLVKFNGLWQDPEGRLLADAGGNLYGTTRLGGPNDKGTVFKVANDVNHTLSTLATFNGTNGDGPVAGLLASGNLYGTTVLGGANGDGTVFEVANDANHTLSTLVSFNNATNGRRPLADLIADASGNLYGTTSGGGPGAYGPGTVFEVAADTHELTTLFTFNGLNGFSPHGGLIADASGNLFGTTHVGGAYVSGTVFELSPVSEPATFILAAIGLIGLVMFRPRRAT